MADVAVLHQTDIPSAKIPYLPEETAPIHSKKPPPATSSSSSSSRSTPRSTSSSNKTTAWHKNTNNTAPATPAPAGTTGGNSGSGGGDKNQDPASGGGTGNKGEKRGTSGVKQQVESGIDIPQLDQVSHCVFGYASWMIICLALSILTSQYIHLNICTLSLALSLLPLSVSLSLFLSLSLVCMFSVCVCVCVCSFLLVTHYYPLSGCCQAFTMDSAGSVACFLLLLEPYTHMRGNTSGWLVG